MQFVPNGPDIPDALLQAHEDGNVVFFCGAGISYPAGLPGFSGLVDKIYKLVGTERSETEDIAYKSQRFDSTLDLLERRLPGDGRLTVRRALAKALKPNLRREGATDTHASLLQLARNRENVLRLVTTNFDCIFDYVAKRDKLHINRFSAPMLPIPKRSRWDGLVYLHGLLPAPKDELALHRLVVTSGDFGLAYLTERWASRFVGELFRNYVICFVGYSINDPVLRYMMDALAADRMLGEVTPSAYALGEAVPGKELERIVEWESKGVTPILYRTSEEERDHQLLHSTLKKWAEIYRDGITGKERIVAECAIARPSESSAQDNFVGRMLWALSDPSGIPAKRFAEFNPVPSLDWLEAFSLKRFKHADLVRFGVQPQGVEDEKLSYSLMYRPAPYARSPLMALVSDGETLCQWDAVATQLANWLTRHLDDPALILWLANNGGQLHPWLTARVEERMDHVARLRKSNNTVELERITANAPNAIPRPLLFKVWRLILSGRVRSNQRAMDAYRWISRFKREGLSATLRIELRNILAPKIALQRPFLWRPDDNEAGCPKRLKQLVDWDLVLATHHVRSAMSQLDNSNQWRDALPLVLHEFEQLLRDALDLFCELGEPNDQWDRSFFDLPSISEHPQNRGFHDWVILIELLRDAWLEVLRSDPTRAALIAKSWFEMPYPTFKRLALFAARFDGCIRPEQWVNWLLADQARWLWSSETKRETLRLLVLQGQFLNPRAQGRLERALLAGPPRSMYRADIDQGDWIRIVDGSIWLRLAKLKSSGIKLGASAAKRLKYISDRNPLWVLAGNESDEFSTWISGSADPDFEERRNAEAAPLKGRELVLWLQDPVRQGLFHEESWSERCRNRPAQCFFALSDLADSGKWFPMRWSSALYAWSDKKYITRSWACAAPLVQSMPDETMKVAAHAVSWWLEAVSKTLSGHEVVFINLCRRILELEVDEQAGAEDIVGKSLNHPIGQVTEALLNLWFKREPKDDGGLPADLEAFFTGVCDTSIERFRFGRVLLARNLIAFFRVDPRWTKLRLLPLFDWGKGVAEARAAWLGFLWSPQLYQPILEELKVSLLETPNHYEELGDHAQQFSTFLTYAALNVQGTYTMQEFRAAFSRLPQKGLDEAARVLVQALDSTGVQRERYWTNRVRPFLRKVWPKDRQLASNNIAESFIRLNIVAGDKFPEALEELSNWLRPIEHPDFLVSQLNELKQAARFPAESLTLLERIVDRDQPWGAWYLRDCLDSIGSASPTLMHDSRFRRLDEYCRRHGK